jgi:hypothetical protein
MDSVVMQTLPLESEPPGNVKEGMQEGGKEEERR